MSATGRAWPGAERPVLVAVTRIRNEEDIVEAFLRHHATLVDQHVLLDDGSTDATLAIVTALRQEGLPLQVFQDECPWFDERGRNTFLLHQAARLGADWVLHLDCDEFIDAAALPAPLRTLLAKLPAGVPAVTGELVAYHPTSADDAGEPIVPLRIRHRARSATGIPKVFERAALAGHPDVVVRAGNHGLELNGEIVPLPALPLLTLAHYAVRSGWQMLAKATVGRLKVLATGAAESARGSSSHYTELVDHLIHRPHWVTDAQFLAGTMAPAAVGGDGVVDRPLHYLGGQLRYTPGNDARLAALKSVLVYAETLARSHGALRDAAGLHATARTPLPVP